MFTVKNDALLDLLECLGSFLNSLEVYMMYDPTYFDDGGGHSDNQGGITITGAPQSHAQNETGCCVGAPTVTCSY